MANLPVRGQTGSLDDTAVTREQFRQGIGSFLEYVAQALGGVAGTYGTQAVDPANPTLASSSTTTNGAKLKANPPNSSNDLRIPTTAWVKGNAAPETGADFIKFKGGTTANNVGVCWGADVYRGTVLTVQFPSQVAFSTTPAVFLQVGVDPGLGLWAPTMRSASSTSFEMFVSWHGMASSSPVQEGGFGISGVSFSYVAIGTVT